ncbi:hypothetical protein Dimus_027835 [Dionaea muscipula]
MFRHTHRSQMASLVPTGTDQLHLLRRLRRHRHHHHHQRQPASDSNSLSNSASCICFPTSCCSSSFSSLSLIHRTRPLHSFIRFPSNRNLTTRHCCSCSPAPPEAPPQPDPPPVKIRKRFAGAAVNFSKFQEGMRIFFAVLFWLSLFFWASAWDGRDNGRKSKGNRFKR